MNIQSNATSMPKQLTKLKLGKRQKIQTWLNMPQIPASAANTVVKQPTELIVIHTQKKYYLKLNVSIHGPYHFS